jgi:hypothetical protein
MAPGLQGCGGLVGNSFANGKVNGRKARQPARETEKAAAAAA